MSSGITEMFSRVAPRYELVNHLMTLGLDRMWRRGAARLAAARNGDYWLDVCSGTGEMAAQLRRRAQPHTRVLAVDFCLPMLRKAASKEHTENVQLLVADASSLPFNEGSVDLITIAFATRNLQSSHSSLEHYFKEFYRLLKPGGRLVNLETSQPALPWFRNLFHLYVRLVVEPLGSLFSGQRAAYGYLSRSIRNFYNAQELSKLLQQVGFRSVTHYPLCLGAAAIHEAIK